MGTQAWTPRRLVSEEPDTFCCILIMRRLFAGITSDFYPALQTWYDQSNLEWLEANTEKEDLEDPDREDEQEGQECGSGKGKAEKSSNAR